MAVGKMWFRARNNAWYVKIDGKQRRLSPDKEDALKIYERLVAQYGTKAPTVREGVLIYLAWVKESLSEGTYEKKAECLNKLAESKFGSLLAADFNPKHVKRWLSEAYPDVAGSTINDRITVAQACWSYLAKDEHIPKSKLRGMAKPPAGAKEFFLHHSRFEELINACRNQSLRDLVSFLLYTGARVTETRKLQRKHFSNDRFVLNNSEGKRRRGRVIYIPDSILPMVKRRLQGLPAEGFVFTNTRGRPWTKDSMGCAFSHLKKRLKEPKLSPYSLRHSFAAYHISQGKQFAVIAKLLGHSSVQMIYQRYGHLDQQADLMLSALNAPPIQQPPHASA